MRDGYLRGSITRPATQRQMDVLAAFVAAGGSIQDAAELVGIRPSTAKRHLADLRARSGLSTEQLIYVGGTAGWLVVDIADMAGWDAARLWRKPVPTTPAPAKPLRRSVIPPRPLASRSGRRAR